MSDVDVSIVVCTRNEAPRLRLALRALQQQTVRPREIIVVDDASTDETPSLLREARAWFPPENLRCIRHDVARGSAGARNAGARAANGALLLFLDGDVLPTPDHVLHHVGFHAARRDTIAIGALCHVVTTEFLRDPSTGELFPIETPDAVRIALATDERWALVTQHDVMHDFASIVARSLPGTYPHLGWMEDEGMRVGEGGTHAALFCLMSPQNVSLHRERFVDIEGFDETLPFCEGWDLVLRAADRGAVPRRLGHAATYHLYHHRSQGDWSQHVRRWSAVRRIGDKLERPALVATLLLFMARAGDPYLCAPCVPRDLDMLAGVLSTGGLGPLQRIVDKHPRLCELEEACANPLAPAGRRRDHAVDCSTRSRFGT